MELARSEAIEHGLNPDRFIEVITCENREWNPTKQSGITYAFSDPKRHIVEGTRERSYGLAMIHRPDHPDLSYAQATDPEFALEWMATQWEQGRAWMWSCYTSTAR